MATGVTTVDCHKQVRSWRLLRSLMQLLIPTCSNCATINNLEHPADVITSQEKVLKNSTKYSSSSVTTTTITGTIFGYRRGKVSFCIQANANSTNPILLLELSVPTSTLAREMRGGTLRIALESRSSSNNNNNAGSCNSSSSSSSASSLLSTPLWTMYCNGKKVGYAVKRKPSNTDVEALRLMRSVVVGTGVMRCKEEGEDGDDEDRILYLRANFQRVRGSSDECESFHLIDPEGGDNNVDQELSIFFFRSR